jgi:fermentation-respiration switch protein FrsA (DUF1100 family)
VTFQNRGIEIIGNLHIPSRFDANETYAAIVLATPGSSVKEQIGGFYAEKLAQRGFVALTFDPSYQGESGGEPRDLEDPAVRVEDIRCAVDYLVTLPFVSGERIGLLGLCAGGGYAINAALTECRFKAIGTPWIPDSPEEAEAAGVRDPEVLEAVKYYRESRFRHPNSTNRLLFSSNARILSFDAFNLVPELLAQPLQVIVGGRRGNTNQYESG